MYNSSRMKSKGKLIFLLSLASFLSAGVLLPFHIFMRWSNQVLSYDYFGSGLGFSFFIVLVSSLAVLEISLLSTVRIRNSSVPVLSYFMERGVHFRFIKAIIFSFLTCTFSFLMGLALGGEAPSVFMGAVSFALVFSFAEENQERLLRAIFGEKVREVRDIASRYKSWFMCWFLPRFHESSCWHPLFICPQ